MHERSREETPKPPNLKLRNEQSVPQTTTRNNHQTLKRYSVPPPLTCATLDPPDGAAGCDRIGVPGGDRAHRGAHGVHRLEVYPGLVRPPVPRGVFSRRHVPAVLNDRGRDSDSAATPGRLAHGGVLDDNHLRPDVPDGLGGSYCYAADDPAQV